MPMNDCKLYLLLSNGWEMSWGMYRKGVVLLSQQELDDMSTEDLELFVLSTQMVLQ